MGYTARWPWNRAELANSFLHTPTGNHVLLLDYYVTKHVPGLLFCVRRRGSARLTVELAIHRPHNIIGRAKRAHLVVYTTGTIFLYIYFIFASSVSPDTVSFLNVSTRFYLGVDAVRNIAILYSRSPTMLKHSSSMLLGKTPMHAHYNYSVRVGDRVSHKCSYVM